jgi:ABC-type Fe3+/spermidine/putrescine transport system ATPase subunit
MNVIEVTNLKKRYGDRAAVDDVSFSVEEGEIFGILGPNGAGKTTTVESIAGLRRPDSGTIRVLGLDPGHDRDRLRTLVGVQLQETELPDRMTVEEALDLFASFYAEPADPNELIDELGLADKRRTMTVTGEAIPLQPDIEIALLRTAQEALANVAKHAGATRAGLTLSFMGDVVTLDVRDDGVGFTVPEPGATDAGKFGLTGMRQRVARVAGSLTIESEPGGGTAISARVPAIRPT